MIAVTGANGLVGSYIVKKLVEEGFPVIAVVRKSSDKKHLQKVIDKIIFQNSDIMDSVSLAESLKTATMVVHTAAMVSFNPREEKELYKINVDGTKNVVDACLLNGIKKLIHISSVAALSRQKGLSSIDENSKWIDNPLNSAYAKSKYLAELEIFRGIEEGLAACIINPSFVLGAGDWEKSSSQLFSYLWKERKFFSSGQMNYVDARDVAEVVFRLSKQDLVGERFIATGGTISYKEIFDMIANRFHKKSPSIKVNTTLLSSFARLEEIRCWMTNSKPLITRESVKATKEDFSYSNKKSIDILQMRYKNLTETLDYCCSYYLHTYSTNK